jgi:homocitrate synthase NifV
MEIRKLKEYLSAGVEMHAHNDFGMAVANSVSAVRAGAEFIGCTVGGMGERAGNCNLLEFVHAYMSCLGSHAGFDMSRVIDGEKEIAGIMNLK